MTSYMCLIDVKFGYEKIEHKDEVNGQLGHYLVGKLDFKEY